MKKATISGVRQSEIVEVPDPQPKEDWAVVKIHATAMCTEYKAWKAGRVSPIIGHEGAGEVVAVAQPGPVKVGDRVVVLPINACGRCALCQAGDWIYCEHALNHAQFLGTPEGSGTFAQYIVKPNWLLQPLPDAISYERATMVIDGVGATFGAMQTIGVSALDTVLVVGLGPVGLGGVLNARYRGARVIGVEPFPWRAERARQMGAEVVFDSSEEDLVAKIKALAGGRGVDVAVDCSGTPEGERVCLDAVRRRGRLALVGECSDPFSLRASPDLLRKGLIVYGNWLWNMKDLPAILKVIETSPLMDLLISHVLPLHRIQEGFELLASGQAAKIVLKPWE